jgi:hypothetical protein
MSVDCDIFNKVLYVVEWILNILNFPREEGWKFSIDSEENQRNRTQRVIVEINLISISWFYTNNNNNK